MFQSGQRSMSDDAVSEAKLWSDMGEDDTKPAGEKCDKLSSSPQRRQWFSRFLLPIDMRAVALFRVAVGCICMSELMQMFFDRHLRLYDTGMCPSQRCMGNLRKTGFGLYDAAGRPLAVLGLLSVHFVVNSCYVLGFDSRLASVGLWVFQYSLEARLTSSGGGGLDVLRAVLFWSLFLPLGGSYSLDSLARRLEGRVHNVKAPNFSIVLAITLQFVYLYYSAGSVKMHRQSWREGIAVEHVLQLQSVVKHPLGPIIGQWKTLCKLLTYTAVYVEKYGGFLLLVPNQTVRAITLFVFFGFHIGMHLTMTIDAFQLTMISGLLLLLPGQCCDFFERKLRPFGCRLQEHLGCTPVPRPVSVAWAEGHLFSLVCKTTAKLQTIVAHILPLALIYFVSTNICQQLIRRSPSSCYPSHVFEASIPWLDLFGMRQSHVMFNDPVGIGNGAYLIVGLASSSRKDPRSDWKVVSLWYDATLSFEGHLLSLDVNTLLATPSIKTHKWFKFFDHMDGLDASSDTFASSFAQFACEAWDEQPHWGLPPTDVRRLLGINILKIVQDRDRYTLEWQRPQAEMLFQYPCHDVATEEIARGEYWFPYVTGIMPEDIKATMNADNPSSCNVEVFYVRPSTGEERPRKFLQPGATERYSSFVGHTWHFRWPWAPFPAEPAARITLSFNPIQKVSLPSLRARVTLENRANKSAEIYWQKLDGPMIKHGSLPGLKRETSSVEVCIIYTFVYDDHNETFQVGPSPEQVFAAGK